MSEEENELIKELIMYKNDENIPFILPPYPLQNRNCVKMLSKSISDIIYNSNSDEVKGTIIRLISKWIRFNSNVINDSNVNVFIKYLTTSKPDHLCEKNIIDEKYYVERKEPFNMINNMLERKYKIYTEHKIKADLIQKWDTIQMNQIDFKFNSFLKPIENRNLDQIIQYFKQFINRDNDVSIINVIEDETNETVRIESKIGLFYAVLNLPITNEQENLLESILTDFSKQKSKNISDFIEHLWNNKEQWNLSIKLRRIILFKFPYIYEKVILNLATKILEQCDSSTSINEYKKYIFESESKIEEICELSKNELQLKINIISVLNKLIEFSYFDERLLILMCLLIQQLEN